MSVFHGKQGKGAMRAHRADKTREAVERQARFDAEVARIQYEQNTGERTARFVALSTSKMRYLKARRAVA